MCSPFVFLQQQRITASAIKHHVLIYFFHSNDKVNYCCWIPSGPPLFFHDNSNLGICVELNHCLCWIPHGPFITKTKWATASTIEKLVALHCFCLCWGKSLFLMSTTILRVSLITRPFCDFSTAITPSVFFQLWNSLSISPFSNPFIDQASDSFTALL